MSETKSYEIRPSASTNMLLTQLKKIPSKKMREAAYKALGEKSYQASVRKLRFIIYNYICNHAYEYGGASLDDYLKNAKKILRPNAFDLYLLHSLRQIAGYSLTKEQLYFVDFYTKHINTEIAGSKKQMDSETVTILKLLKEKNSIFKEHKDNRPEISSHNQELDIYKITPEWEGVLDQAEEDITAESGISYRNP